MSPANAPKPPLTLFGKLLFTIGALVALSLAYVATALLEDRAKLPGMDMIRHNRNNLLVLAAVIVLIGRSAVSQLERGTLKPSTLKNLLPFVDELLLSLKDLAPTCFAILLAVTQTDSADTWAVPALSILFFLTVFPITIGLFFGDSRLRRRDHFSHAVLVELVVCVGLVACGWLGTTLFPSNPGQLLQDQKPLLLPATTLGIIGAVAAATASLALAKVPPVGTVVFVALGSLVGGLIAVGILRNDERPQTLAGQILLVVAAGSVVAAVCVQAVRRVRSDRFQWASVGLTSGVGFLAGSVLALIDRPSTWLLQTASFTSGIVAAAIGLEFLLGCAWVRSDSIEKKLRLRPFVHRRHTAPTFTFHRRAT